MISNCLYKFLWVIELLLTLCYLKFGNNYPDSNWKFKQLNLLCLFSLFWSFFLCLTVCIFGDMKTSFANPDVLSTSFIIYLILSCIYWRRFFYWSPWFWGCGRYHPRDVVRAGNILLVRKKVFLVMFVLHYWAVFSLNLVLQNGDQIDDILPPTRILVYISLTWSQYIIGYIPQGSNSFSYLWLNSSYIGMQKFSVACSLTLKDLSSGGPRLPNLLSSCLYVFLKGAKTWVLVDQDYRFLPSRCLYIFLTSCFHYLRPTAWK